MAKKIIASVMADLGYMIENVHEFGLGGVKDDFEYMVDNVRMILQNER